MKKHSNVGGGKPSSVSTTYLNPYWWFWKLQIQVSLKIFLKSVLTTPKES